MSMYGPRPACARCIFSPFSSGSSAIGCHSQAASLKGGGLASFQGSLVRSRFNRIPHGVAAELGNAELIAHVTLCFTVFRPARPRQGAGVT